MPEPAPVRHGRLDLFAAKAGISAGPGYPTEAGRLSGVSDAQRDRVLAVSPTSVFAGIRAAARHVAPRGFGRIPTVASAAGIRAEPVVGCTHAATEAMFARIPAASRAPDGTDPIRPRAPVNP